LRNTGVRQGRIQCNKPPRSQVSLQRQHQPVAVDDAGAGRKQGSDAFQRGFHDLRLGSIQPLQVRDTIAERTVVNASEAFALLICSSHQQFAAPPVLHATLLGIGIKLLTACNAQARLERAGGVVKARMDDFAVAELVPVPMASAASSTITSSPCKASFRAIAKPTTPAPTTTHST
jgi:hypothetical protein